MLIQGNSMKLLVLSAFEQLLRFSVCVDLCGQPRVYVPCVYVYVCLLGTDTPLHSQLDRGTWSCGSLASVEVPDSATSNG